jgi:adenylate cyclase
MPDLIAQGPQNYHRWRREVPDPASCTEIVIGRSDADWNVPWDSLISRAHVRLIPQPDERVEIMVIGAARNPVYHRGRQALKFVLVPGDHFVIGKTTFTLAGAGGIGRVEAAAERSGTDGSDVTESVFDHVALRRRHFQDVNARIDVLTRLPDLIASSESDEELLVRVTSVLLQSTPAATSVSILAATGLESDPDADIEVLHYDNRGAAIVGSPISRRLVRRAIEKRESVLNVWMSATGPAAAAFTAREDVDWAFCVPLRSDACRGWVIYISGQLPDEQTTASENHGELSDQLQDDVKFAELVGTTVASLRQSHRLQRRQAAMRNFFAPVVMKALASADPRSVLAPREADLTVMFCDLRGFSRRSERDANKLLKLLSDVSDALGVMTKHILGFDGVIGDFHGDAAMGFWGWPLDQSHTAQKAVRAALAIRSEYQRSDLGFRCGIGIAHGRAVAGRIGTKDQVKVTAFGPVVNLASRLESMTKRFASEIIIDEATKHALERAGSEDSTPEKEATLTFADEAIRIRQLANVRPAGFQQPARIYQVLSISEMRDRGLTDQHLNAYQVAVDLLADGRRREAIETLKRLPTSDGPTQFLLRWISEHETVDGIIDLPK